MPELKRVPTGGKMDLDRNPRIVSPDQYREALNVNVGRSETSEVGTVESLLGNQRVGEVLPVEFTSGNTAPECIGSYRDNSNERIFFFVTTNERFDEGRGGNSAIVMYDQRSDSTRILAQDGALNFHKNFPITGVNLLEDLLFWTDDRNEPRKINIDRAILDPTYYRTDVLMSVAKPAPFTAATVATIDRTTTDVSSNFLENKLPRFSYRWQFDDGEYSVLAPFTPIVFQPADGFTLNRTEAGATGQQADFVNAVKQITLIVPVAQNAGVTNVELLYKDVASNTVYIIEEAPVSNNATVNFTYSSQDPFRAIPNSQVIRVSDAVPRRALAQEVAGGRIVYGNFLQNYNIPSVNFSVSMVARDDRTVYTNHSLKTRRTYQVGIVLSDRSGRSTPVILSAAGGDTIFHERGDALTAQQFQIRFTNPSQIEDLIRAGFSSYRVVVKQTQQEYYNWFTSGAPGSLTRFGDNINKVPLDQTASVSEEGRTRPSSRLVYVDNTLTPVTINQTNGLASVTGISGDSAVEVEPVESLIDIFFETPTGGELLPDIAQAPIRVDYFNCYIVGEIEANRIRMGFNDPNFDFGVRAHQIDEEFAGEERRPNALIHSSGFFNSRTGLNQLNQFSESAGGITLSLDPADGSIQKLYAEDTQIIIFQEDKVSRSPVDKDFIYSAEGGAVPVTSNTQYLGTVVTYAGEYGISQDPESFSVYGTRKYFTDKNRGVVLRLSNDGLTEISRAGLSDFFRDALRRSTSVIGSFDEYHNTYNLTIRGDAYDRFEDTNRATGSEGYFTVGYEEDTQGWVSFKSFAQESGTTLNNTYYTFNQGLIWEHNREDVPSNSFYGNQGNSYVDFIFNDSPSLVKHFKTLGYEGMPGWECEFIETEIESIGPVPEVANNYIDATLSVDVAPNEAENIVFTGDTTNQVELGANGLGTTKWILEIAPISAQYALEMGDVIVQIVDDMGNPIGLPNAAELNPDNGRLYAEIDVTNISLTNRSITVRLSGDGAGLAFVLVLATVIVDNQVVGASFDGSRIIEYDVAGPTTSTLTVRADQGNYIDTSMITTVQTDPDDTIGDVVVSNTPNSFTDINLTLPITVGVTPAEAATLAIVGAARPIPNVTWGNGRALTGFLAEEDRFFNNRMEPIAFDTPVPISPREPDANRTFTRELRFNSARQATHLFFPTMTAQALNATLVTDINQEMGVATFAAESDIDTMDIQSNIDIINGIAVEATLGASNLPHTVDYRGAAVRTEITGTLRLNDAALDITATPAAMNGLDGITTSIITAGGSRFASFTVPAIDINDTTNTVRDSRVALASIGTSYNRLTSVTPTTFNITQRPAYELVSVEQGPGVLPNTFYAITINYPDSLPDVTAANFPTTAAENQGWSVPIVTAGMDQSPYKQAIITTGRDTTVMLPTTVLVVINGNSIFVPIPA